MKRKEKNSRINSPHHPTLAMIPINLPAVEPNRLLGILNHDLEDRSRRRSLRSDEPAAEPDLSSLLVDEGEARVLEAGFRHGVVRRIELELDHGARRLRQVVAPVDQHAVGPDLDDRLAHAAVGEAVRGGAAWGRGAGG